MSDGDTSTLTLDEQLCFPLHSATRAIVGCYRPGLDAIGLTYSQYLVMLVLWERGAVSVGHLGEELFMDSGTLSPLVKRLEARELVTRRRRLDDERVVEVEATAAGAALLPHAERVQAEVAAATGLDVAELADLREQLCALARRLRAHSATRVEETAALPS